MTELESNSRQSIVDIETNDQTPETKKIEISVPTGEVHNSEIDQKDCDTSENKILDKDNKSELKIGSPLLNRKQRNASNAEIPFITFNRLFSHLNRPD